MEDRMKFSTKIILLSWLLSIGVVYQHTQWGYCGKGLTATYQFVFFLIETCVPCFFMISGYLFYRTYQPGKAKEKLCSRIRTLLIPYVIWNIVYGIFIITMMKIGLINNASIAETPWEILSQIMNAEFSPLWFVKYLMIFVLISPIMYFVLRNKYIGAVFLVLSMGANIYFYYSGKMLIPLNVNANNLIMFNYQYIFFTIGAYFALNFPDFVENSNRRKRIGAIGGLLILLIFYVFMRELNFGNAIISHGFRIIYICALWFVIDFLPEVKICSWMKNSFFLYCSHLIVLQCVQRVCDIILAKIGLENSLLSVAEYIVLPLIIIAFLMLSAEIMKKYIPKTWSILTGGRG